VRRQLGVDRLAAGRQRFHQLPQVEPVHELRDQERLARFELELESARDPLVLQPHLRAHRRVEPSQQPRVSAQRRVEPGDRELLLHPTQPVQLGPVGVAERPRADALDAVVGPQLERCPRCVHGWNYQC
jgi:hypothetical protein